jgi:hypothetical protein
MKASELTITLFALLPFTGCVLPSDDEDTGNQGTEGSGGSESSTMTPSTTAQPSTTGETTDSTGAESESSSGVETTSETTGDPPPTNCATASLLLGNPYYDGDIGGSNPEGQGMLEDPPLRSRHLAALPDDRLAIETQSEVWVAENGQMHRIAGMEDDPSDTRYEPNGACADVRVLIAAGVTGLPDGRIVVADTRGNGLIELRDPFGDCQGAAIAGNPDMTYDLDVPGPGTAAPGDVDGPGAIARFDGVERPVSDDDGNIYVIDTGNQAFKRIADDADRTVSTVFRYDDGLPMAMTVMNGTLYVTGTIGGGDDFVWAIDIEAGTREVLFQGGGLFDEIYRAELVTMFGLTNDGVDLLVASGQGYIFRLSTAAEPLGVVAGFGTVFDYPTDLDLTMPIPTAELPIRSYAIGQADLVRSGNDLLFTNNANGVGFHVWSIHCE